MARTPQPVITRTATSLVVKGVAVDVYDARRALFDLASEGYKRKTIKLGGGVLKFVESTEGEDGFEMTAMRSMSHPKFNRYTHIQLAGVTLPVMVMVSLVGAHVQAEVLRDVLEGLSGVVVDVPA